MSKPTGVRYTLGTRYGTFEVELEATPDYPTQINKILDGLHSQLAGDSIDPRVIDIYRVVAPMTAMRSIAISNPQAVGLLLTITFSYERQPMNFEWPNWSND
jgi:hypothetical protein